MSEGSVYQRKSDLRWVAKWQVNGKWRYLYRKTEAEARKALRKALRDRDDNIVPVGKMTLNDLLDTVALERCPVHAEAAGSLALWDALLNRLDDLLAEVYRVRSHASALPGAALSQPAVRNPKNR